MRAVADAFEGDAYDRISDCEPSTDRSDRSELDEKSTAETTEEATDE